ncbi:hypothetical protein K2173_006729 [Erythroxylum novogranatense]|uniref:Condensin complex subunit 2 n=1 Tax=Erythroxylum novogranatense TaxID=1862640 RepID=A0AAV8TCP3_9ROSI|nr:hypothetical protein K2173_006729 [Erythroxylum novogranatense]
MADVLSPNATQKQRLPRIQSPTTPFFLGSNNDQLERAQARAARAAAIRRKSVSVKAPPPDPCLDKAQILDLFRNCIKLASENKINQKNTWELNLIDHLCEIIKVEEEEDVETNFQKASCTLEAGVKIYALRVDSVHSEAYKVLGGINRAGQENEQDATVEDTSLESGRGESHPKKEKETEISPLSTLEPSFEALNAKKFDVAFAVDPLYHQTSAQFDEGGAKGLLLNNLGVYGDCRVLFDSQEIPGKFVSCDNQHKGTDAVDLSFARDYIEQMVLNIRTTHDISPTLRSIVNQFDENNKRPLDNFTSQQKLDDQIDNWKGDYSNETELNGDSFENSQTWAFDHEDHRSAVDEDPDDGDATFPSYYEEHEPFSFHNPEMEDRFEKLDTYLSLNLGFSMNQNAWAGPDHWKYRKAKCTEGSTEKGSPLSTKRPRTKKQLEPDIDFTKALEDEMPDVFAAPKNPKSLLLPANRTPSNNKLPEDCHYQPENLVKLFLLPNVMCLGKSVKKFSDDWAQKSDDCGPSWDDGNDLGGRFDDGNICSDVEDSNELVSQPRQVNKIEVQYDKTSKQVDVQALKETIWHQMQYSAQASVKGQEDALSFRELLSCFPGECGAAATARDISPHLCFICLLHLANENGLSIHGSADLDDLRIYLPGK